ncbi:hypothetical protein J0676_05910 [Vibrio sp. Vb2880]|uniref:hypothetical protein n=1 Tax=Vibrio sp. Vb2880 TaxID=2816076 RepID=UPI001A8C0B08|nr:hypothetical protein [Vibrio sp. Vb2880]MBO0213014.1 hypothetical protein [Vibrio sp. Vb2880]
MNNNNVTNFPNEHFGKRGGGNGGGDDMLERVVKLESNVVHIRKDIELMQTELIGIRHQQTEISKSMTAIQVDMAEIKGSNLHTIRLMYLILGSVVAGIAGLLFAAVKVAFFS